MKIKQTLTMLLLVALLFTHPQLVSAKEDVALLETKNVALATEEIEERAEADALTIQQPDPAANAAGATEEESPDRWIGTVKLTSGNLNIRKGPTMEDEIIGKLSNGTKVEVLEQLDEWVRIPYEDSHAYVAKPYLIISKASIKPNDGSSKVIILDPGHGGKDPGAIAPDKTYESILVWSYASQAKETLEQAGYTVVLTRNEKNSCVDYKSIYDELNCRSELAKKASGHIYISLHADANPSKKFRGTVTFYNARDDLDGRQNPFPEESKKLAELIHKQVQPTMGSTDRGIQNKNYYVNRMNTVPAVLVELGVMTNAEDLKLLKKKDKPLKVANALTKAVNQYFNEL
jgi:N-acetylmuramoyl-L-alanine amidase